MGNEALGDLTRVNDKAGKMRREKKGSKIENRKLEIRKLQKSRFTR
jgi:hypothetical protein